MLDCGSNPNFPREGMPRSRTGCTVSGPAEVRASSWNIGRDGLIQCVGSAPTVTGPLVRIQHVPMIYARLAVKTENPTKELCNFGCGKVATHRYKSGRWVCCSNHIGCTKTREQRDKVIGTSGGALSIPIDTSRLCEYGCGKVAKYKYSKSSKLSCSPNSAHCPAVCSKRHVTVQNSGIEPFKVIPTSTREKCIYGCGKRAKFKYQRSGKPCCSRNVSSCSAIQKKQSAKARGRKYQPHLNHGYGKSGWYKGIWCESSWELAWVIFHLEHKTPFTRCSDIFKCFDKEGIEREYHPDFKCLGYWIEIKGWETEKWKLKASQFPYPEKLVVLRQKDLTEIFTYVLDKYGSNYTDLYEVNQDLAA